MPVFEFEPSCGCSFAVVEAYLQHWDDPNIPCPKCGRLMLRLVSRFSPVWCRDLSSYNDKSKDYASVDGHWGFNRDGSREYITSRSQQKKFVKRNGFVDPTDVPVNTKLSSDGRSLVNTGNLGEI